MSRETKSFLTLIVLLVLIFGVPYLWRNYRDTDIKENSKYTFGKIVRKTSSLKNGHNWNYDFYFKNQVYRGFWPTHVNYDVQIGDYFIVNFSSKDPTHNKILYDYKLKRSDLNSIGQVWDTIPMTLVESGKKVN